MANEIIFELSSPASRAKRGEGTEAIIKEAIQNPSRLRLSVLNRTKNELRKTRHFTTQEMILRVANEINESGPEHSVAERPTEIADKLGSEYADHVSAAQRKAQGLFLTPIAVANFMAQQIKPVTGTMRLLDPAAGCGVLIAAAIEAIAARNDHPHVLDVVAYEIDPGLIAPLEKTLSCARTWAQKHGMTVRIHVKCGDFILDHAGVLGGLGGLLPLSDSECFDAVIANPPYFKISKDDPRARAASAVVHGQPNIYGLFMAVTAALLRPNGSFVFIIPRSFASGPYFRLFRERFFDLVRPVGIHMFNSRRATFSRDDVLQENIIFSGTRDDAWYRKRGGYSVLLSTSHGMADLLLPEARDMALSSLLDLNEPDKVLRIPSNDDETSILELVDSWPGNLARYGLGISTGPVVPFRAREHLEDGGQVPERHAPMLWMGHVHAMTTRWPNGVRKPQYIRLTALDRGILLPNRNYVLLRRFSAKEEKRRLTAAPYIAREFDTPFVGLENHLNYIHRPGGSLGEDEAWGLSALYNSRILDTYFRAINGNTQVSATELRAMPLPDYDVIEEIGRQARVSELDSDSIDALVLRAILEPRTATKRRKVVAHV